MSIGKISSNSAKNYYYEKDPVFNENGEGNNLEWHGKQAEILSLENGNVGQKEFENLLNGKSPDGDTQLLDRSKKISNGKDNAVFDMPLSAPKSVSIVALGEGGDKRLIEAHDKAVKATIEHLEKNYAKTRGYKEGENGEKIRESYKTENLLIATAKHSTARPTPNDPEPNAHLHTHTLVFNQTYDKNTNSFKALDTKDMFRDQKEINQVYLSNLAKNVKDLGYGIEDNGKGSFNLKGVSEEVIDKFSSRRNEVNEQMQAIGATSEKERARIGQTMKSEKVDMSSKELKESWDRKLEEVNTSVKELKENALENSSEKEFSSAKEVLEKTMQLLTENESYVTEKELLKGASEISIGEYTTDQLKSELDNVKKIGQKEDMELKSLGENKKGERIFTNKEIYDIEKENRALAKELGSNNNGSIMSKEQAEAGLKDFEDKNFTLTKGQKEAALGILTSKESVIAIQGDAGTGKSAMLAAVNHALEFNQNQAQISLAAPTNKAVSGAIEASKTSSGKSFDGQTVHKLVNSNNKINNETAINKVINISENMNDIHIATGNKAFDNSKNFLGVKKQGFSLDPANRFSIKLKGLEASFKDVKKSGDNTIIRKQSKVNRGEFKGSIKKEITNINKSGTHIKYQQNIRLNNGEKFQQKIESYNPLNTSIGKGNSPVNKLTGLVASSYKREVINSKSKLNESKKTLAGIQLEKKTVKGINADQTKIGLKVLGGLAKAEHNVLSLRFENGAKNIDTKSLGIIGFKVKTSIETNYDKYGNITSKTMIKEKSLLGMTFGKATVIDKNGNSKDIEYKKVFGKVKEDSIKVVKESKVDLKEDKQLKKNENDFTVKKSDKMLIIDEDSMLSAKNINQILKIAKEESVNVAFMGDSKQLGSIGAGNSLNDLKEFIKSFEMTEGQRQRNDLEKSVTDTAAAKKIEQSLENIEKNGNLKEVSRDKIVAEAVKQITKEETAEIKNFKGEKETVKLDYKNTAGLAATNKENKAINEGVREVLKSQNKITNEVHNVKVNVNANMSNTKQMRATNYSKDMKLTTFDNVKGMKKGTEYKIIDIDKSKNTLKLKSEEVNPKTNKHDFTTVKASDIASKITIKKEEERSFGVGDKVVITETNKDIGVRNSDSGLIVNMDQKNKVATIDFGEAGKKDIDLKNFKGLDHGYSTTNYKAQGISVDRVVATIDSKNKTMNSSNSYYVALSRQKAKSVLVTDNKESIKKQVTKESVNRSTQEDFSKKGEVEIKQKVSDNLKNEINSQKDIKRDSDKTIKPSEAFDKSDKIATQRNLAKSNNDVDKYVNKQKEFMNMQVVARNGYSSKKVESFAKVQVERGSMTEKQADQFVKNSNENAKSLKDAGILEEKKSGEYKFVDSKAKEILYDNADKSHNEIAQKNLEAYNKANNVDNKIETKTENKSDNKIDSKVDSKADNKIEPKTENKSEKSVEPKTENKSDNKDSLNDLDKSLSKIESSSKDLEQTKENQSEKSVETKTDKSENIEETNTKASKNR
jgi:conjugative relaxase-like TrwC/TraI family protein